MSISFIKTLIPLGCINIVKIRVIDGGTFNNGIIFNGNFEVTPKASSSQNYIIAYNEAEKIRSAINSVLWADEIILADSYSQDDTAAVARAAGARVVRQQGQGYAGALHTGYRACHQLGVQRLVQLDGDGQHPPAAAPRLLEALAEGNLIMASRSGTTSPAPLSRRLANLLLSAIVQRVTGLPLRDVTSGFWALDARAITVFAEHFPPDVADANVRVMADRAGLSIVEIPVPMPQRGGGRSMHQGAAGFGNLLRSLHAISREARHRPPCPPNQSGIHAPNLTTPYADAVIPPTRGPKGSWCESSAVPPP